MDFKFIAMCGKLIFSLTVVLLLIFILSKLAGNKINDITNKRYMKVVDRLIITKDNSLIIVRVGDKGYLLSNTSKNINVIDEISIEEIEKIQHEKQKSLQEMQNVYGSILTKLRESKGKGHEN